MKRNIFNLQLALAFCALSVFLSGCKKHDEFLEIRDRGGIDAAIWDNEGAIQFLLNETYDLTMPDFPYQVIPTNHSIHLASDESYFSATDGNARRALGLNGELTSNDVRIVGAGYTGRNKYGNRYFDVARCNGAITNIPLGTLPVEAKNRFLGQFYTLRAIIYFEMARIYGGVPLVLEPQDPQNLSLGGRATARQMFDQVVKDLDSAMVKLEGVTWNDATERGKLTRAAAAALKSKALLYWASPQFNVSNKEPQRWEVAHTAAREAYDICLAAGRKLMPKYEDIFRVEGAANTEAIIVKSYSATVINRNNNVEARVRPASEQGQPTDAYLPTTRMIDAYTMNDGTPITGNPNYDPLLFWKDRDPRFDATIAFNGSNWKLSGNANRRQWTYVNAAGEGTTNRGFYVKRFSSPDLPTGSVRPVNNTGGSGMDWIELRFAEVMLNYAETANEVGDMALAKTLVRDIRKRAGIVAGTQDYGLGLATTIEAMRELIINERMVEFAFENKRPDDLRRTRKMHQLSGTLETIQVETKSAALKTELERIIDPANGTRYRETLNINNKDSVNKYFRHVLVRPTDNGTFNIPEKYYFFGLWSQFMNSTPLLVQTIGWDSGTFDPLAD